MRAGALALGLAAPAAALAATPSLTWSGAEEVVVHCTVQAPGRDPVALSRALCERVRTLAAQGAPMPVRAGVSGSPMLEPATAVSLIVHAGLHPAPGAAGEVLAFTIRPFRRGTEDTHLLGTVPRIAPVSGGGLGSPAADAALEAALDETLPWRTAGGPRGR
ncbi:hypothetical protein [Phenylobacterium sp.]|uniref:hypothetical protein n=1 Tax=Phenylobacterium sp. TaxID=1871053 RepID=UPI002CFF4820|nr:hypothetical protein [Phenylobacterium sp.]HVI34327.1 hypothetical protein [Phenylobacterium sp.]